jgi:hypothetical protein
MEENQAEQATARPVKYFEDQMDGEEVLFIFRKHPVVMRKGLIIASLGLLVGPLATIAITYIKPELATMTLFFGSLAVSFVLAAILFLPTWMSWHFSIFIVSDQRLIQITQKGFFHRSVVDMGLSQIRMVNYEVSGLQETLLGFGTLLIQTQVGDLTVHEVPKPARIQKQLLEVLRDEGITDERPEFAQDQEYAEEA